MRVLIVHPDLGVGGAERLILDIATATRSNGHEVSILTNQYFWKVFSTNSSQCQLNVE